MINKNFKKGFTLIETLAAVLLLSIALVGPMVIAQKGLQSALTAKDQNSAFNLVQDAVEYVRFARDTNCLHANAGGCPAINWLNGPGVDLSNCTNTAGTAACYLDSMGNNPPNPTSCGAIGNACPVINYDSTNNYFNYASLSSSVTASIFTRTINIKYNNNCDNTCNSAEADVTVTVSWSDPVAHSIVVNESIYDWQ
jgi:prepilin-type N-terminal cleavage/methylation domain-containing protein